MAEEKDMTESRPRPTTAPGDAPARPGLGDDADSAPESGPPSGPPRWAKVLGIGIGIVLVLGFLLLHLTGAVGPSAH